MPRAAVLAGATGWAIGRRGMRAMNRRVVRPVFARQPREVTAASSDGVIAFKLTLCASGVHLERSQVLEGSGLIVQSMLFHDDASFIRWCEADRLKFAYPLLYASLTRRGCALFTPAA